MPAESEAYILEVPWWVLPVAGAAVALVAVVLWLILRRNKTSG